MAVAARGRPVGLSDSKIAKAREAYARYRVLDGTMTGTAVVETIAREFGVASSTVWNYLALATGTPTEVKTTIPGTSPVHRPAPRMSQRAALYRAWLALHLDGRLRRLDHRTRWFWLETVLAVHGIGDGFGLNFADCGFDDRADFASSYDGDDALLELLVRRRLLESDEDGVSLPPALGLTRGERVGGKLVPTAIPGPVEPRQMHFPPTGLPTPRDQDSGENPRGDSTNIRAFDLESSPDSGENRPGDSGKTAVAPAALTDDDDKESDSSIIVVSHTEAGRAPATEPDSGKNDSGKNDSEKNTAAVVTRAETLLAAANIVRPPNFKEISLVRAWIAAGITEEVGVAVIRHTLPRAAVPPVSLQYFDKEMADAVKPGARSLAVAPPAAVPPAPEPPETPEETVDWLGDHPDNPSLLTAWTAIRATLRAEAGDSEYRHWLRPMVLRGVDVDEIVIALPSEFARDWVRDHHGTRISALWWEAYPNARRVDFQVNNRPGDG